MLLTRGTFVFLAGIVLLPNSLPAAFRGRSLTIRRTSRASFCDQSKEGSRHRCLDVTLDRRRPSAPVPLWMASEDDDSVEGDDDPRNNFGRQLRGLRSTGLKTTIETGDTVICRREIPSLGIWEGKSYELRSIYAQKFQEQSQTVERIALQSLDDPVPPGYDRYVTLYSPLYTSGQISDNNSPVIVTPEEVGLVSVRRELMDSVLLAIPGFFWVVVAISFYNYYHERTGGTFFDAIWGR